MGASTPASPREVPGPPGLPPRVRSATLSGMTGQPLVGTVVVDFDGTIVEQDVSERILEAYAPGEWWDIDLEFQRGEIGSRECLVRQGSLVTATEPEMLAFVLDNHAVEPTFAPFVSWAHDAGIRVAVATDGFGFYVRPMLAAAGVEPVEVFGNDVVLDAEPKRFAFPNAHAVCVGCGVCKMDVVRGFRRGGRPVAFVGEGHTDRYGALYADLVFAKKSLVEICERDGIPFLPWESFDEVRDALVTLDRVPGPVAPERCPGWTEP